MKTSSTILSILGHFSGKSGHQFPLLRKRQKRPQLPCTPQVTHYLFTNWNSKARQASAFHAFVEDQVAVFYSSDETDDENVSLCTSIELVLDGCLL